MRLTMKARQEIIGATAGQYRGAGTAVTKRERILSPTLYCSSRVARQRVEADLGSRCVFMHHVDQLLEQEEVAWIRSDSCPDEDEVELLFVEAVSNNYLRGFAEVG